jgi:hypothetical protein
MLPWEICRLFNFMVYIVPIHLKVGHIHRKYTDPHANINSRGNDECDIVLCYL